MDFQVNIQTDFELQVEQFLHELLERGYSQPTINGYRSYLNRMKKYILSLSEQTYNEKTAYEFMEKVVPGLPVVQVVKDTFGQAFGVLTTISQITPMYSEKTKEHNYRH